MADLAVGGHARRGRRKTTVQLPVRMHYRQVYLVDEGGDLPGMLDDSPTTPVGIIRAGSAGAYWAQRTLDA